MEVFAHSFAALGVRPWLVGPLLGPCCSVAFQGKACSTWGLLGSPNQAPFSCPVVPRWGRAASPRSPSPLPRDLLPTPKAFYKGESSSRSPPWITRLMEDGRRRPETIMGAFGLKPQIQAEDN